jgi:ribonuclease BN (tRNA processing enzyme)
MKIKILGNGGAINIGLPYNSFMVDDSVLVEVPPDVMFSLNREKISPQAIEQIFISHMHGDHCFGFPFLALDLLWRSTQDKIHKELTIFLPPGGEEYLVKLTEQAIIEDHPCIRWIKSNVSFVALSDGAEFDLGGYRCTAHLMDHFVETYGFLTYKGDDPLFAYSADTRWCPSMETMLSKSPRAMLCDLNGDEDDMVNVHMKEADIREMGFPLGDKKTLFYGTHLKTQKIGSHERIIFVHPGMEIDI